MSVLQAIIIAIIEGLTEFLPISSTAHMIFASSIMGIQEDDFVKMFQVSIQFGAILAVVVLYWKKFFNLKNLNFYYKLSFAVLPALIIGKLLDDYIDDILGKPIPIAIVLIVGGIVLLFIDNYFKTPEIHKEEDISFKKAITIGFWQCLAMMPGTSRAAASIIGGMQQKLSREVAAEFSFFLAVPTMLAVTVYSIFLKQWHINGIETKGYKMILSDNQHIIMFLLGNIIAFIVAILAIKLFIGFIKKFGFRIWGWYRIIVGIVLLIFFCNATTHNTTKLENEINKIIKNKKADVCVSILDIDSNEKISINGDKHVPMQSVFKLHLAMAILDEVDKDKFDLNQKITFQKSDLIPDTHSPIRDTLPETGGTLTLKEVLQYTVSQSDNVGCDKLFKLIGGTKKVEDFFINHTLKNISIKYNEEEMQKEWNNQFENWTTANASTDLLVAFYQRKFLSQKSYDFLYKTMLETSTGVNRLVAQLPKNALVAHKTGTSGINDTGIRAATNDIGIVTTKDGKHYIISVYVSNSKESEAVNEKIIADISKVTWDYFNK